MEKEQILKQLEEIYREVLDNEDIVLSMSTTSDDINEWDSISHMILVVEIEKKFGLKFTSKETISWNNIEDLVNCIMAK